MPFAAARHLLAPYLRPRPLAVFALGIASGFPLALILATLTFWLAELGVSKGSIGLFAAVTIPYSLKFVWAPFVQSVRLPILARLVGHRRSWLFLVEAGLFVALWQLGTSDPAAHLGATARWAFAVGFLSATQDIVIDGYRIEILSTDEQPAGAAMITVGYRLGLLLSGAGTLMLAEYFGWPTAYQTTAFLILAGAGAAILVGEPAIERTAIKASAEFGRWLEDTLISPVTSFFRQQGLAIAGLIVAFLVLQKLGDAMAAIMTSPLLADLGFTKPEVAWANKVVGAIAAIAGSAMAAATIYWLGMRRALLATSVFMMVSNLMFMGLAMIGHSVSFMAATIGIENFSSALGGTVLVAYLSELCDLRYTATQYAALSALTNIARAFLATPSGFIQEASGWPIFFVISTLAALPGIVLLWLLVRAGGIAETHRRPPRDAGGGTVSTAN